MGSDSAARPPAPRRSVWLWLLAFLLMLGAAAFQRLTGPTHSERGRLELAGQSLRYRLPRSGTTPEDRRVEIPAPGTGASATLRFRRYPSTDEFASREMRSAGARLVGELPVQPAAGKLEYFLEVRAGADSLRLPARPIVLRFKDPVPLAVLLSHVALMFLSMLVGLRAGLGALAGHEGLRRLSWTTLAGLTVGGMILGPIVQKYAFGAFWTGWPMGYDLTDNKTLIMWLVWVVAAFVVGREARGNPRRSRIAVFLAAAVMIGVYLVPHSLGGSELDYSALEQGIDPRDAIRTGTGSG